ncbi:MAG: hypothetical protein J5982_03400 [Bacilli bacterium]|nr:hypothetical protein [Bacilli bacterium]
MDNYYKQIADLQCATERLRTLQEKQSTIFDKYFPITVRYKQSIGSGGNSDKDKMLSYLEELEETGIAKDLEEAIKNVNTIQNRLKRMEIILQSIENISGNDSLEYRVVSLKYFEERSYTLQQIADRLCYSLDRIKQVSADIERKIKANYYTENTL